MIQTNRNDFFGYLSLALGLMAFPGLFCGAIGAMFMGLPALILGVIALKRGVSSTPARVCAIAGTVLGVIAVILALALVAFAGLVLVAGV